MHFLGMYCCILKIPCGNVKLNSNDLSFLNIHFITFLITNQLDWLSLDFYSLEKLSLVYELITLEHIYTYATQKKKNQ